MYESVIKCEKVLASGNAAIHGGNLLSVPLYLHLWKFRTKLRCL